jgi:dimethylaniline monooxygenase (N-oxide forming)
MGHVCIIGAGSSGIASCQVLQARGIAFDCFELGSDIGGNWRYLNDNGMSSAYRSLHINSSRQSMEYARFPIPNHYPNYLGHRAIAKYFDDYVEHFGFRDKIHVRTEVTKVERAPDGRWDVTTRHRDSGETHVRRYRAVLVANGHHWDPKFPAPPFPGTDTFQGDQIHSHYYRTPEPYAGKRILVLGIGNSACDVATDCSEVAERTIIAMRRGAHVVPKYLFGIPTDHLTLSRLGTRTPLWLQRNVLALLVAIARGKITSYGLPKPDHHILCAHPTMSDRLLHKLDHGDIEVKPAIERLGPDRAYFADGSTEEVDTIFYCTGYKVSFPFLDAELFPVQDNRVTLYRRVVPPGLPGLYFIGLVQPIGAIMPMAEIQSEWVADLLEGRATLPSRAAMMREISGYHQRLSRRYVGSTRHTIQVDFYSYLREIRRERRVGARRNGVSHAIPADAPEADVTRQAVAPPAA